MGATESSATYCPIVRRDDEANGAHGTQKTAFGEQAWREQAFGRALRYGDPARSWIRRPELDELGYPRSDPRCRRRCPRCGRALLRSAPRRRPASSTSGCTNPPRLRNAAPWTEAWQGRFLLGLGVSHAATTTATRPLPKPFSKMVEFSTARRRDGPLPRYGTGARRPSSEDARTGLRRCGRASLFRSAGAHCFRGSPARPGPSPPSWPSSSIGSRLRATARRHTAIYTTLPNYTNNLRELATAMTTANAATAPSTRSLRGAMSTRSETRHRHATPAPIRASR